MPVVWHSGRKPKMARIRQLANATPSASRGNSAYIEPWTVADFPLLFLVAVISHWDDVVKHVLHLWILSLTEHS